MKKYLILILLLVSVVVFSGCEIIINWPNSGVVEAQPGSPGVNRYTANNLGTGTGSYTYAVSTSNLNVYYFSLSSTLSGSHFISIYGRHSSGSEQLLARSVESGTFIQLTIWNHEHYDFLRFEYTPVAGISSVNVYEYPAPKNLSDYAYTTIDGYLAAGESAFYYVGNTSYDAKLDYDDRANLFIWDGANGQRISTNISNEYNDVTTTALYNLVEVYGSASGNYTLQTHRD